MILVEELDKRQSTAELKRRLREMEMELPCPEDESNYRELKVVNQNEQLKGLPTRDGAFKQVIKGTKIMPYKMHGRRQSDSSNKEVQQQQLAVFGKSAIHQGSATNPTNSVAGSHEMSKIIQQEKANKDLTGFQFNPLPPGADVTKSAESRPLQPDGSKKDEIIYLPTPLLQPPELITSNLIGGQI